MYSLYSLKWHRGTSLQMEAGGKDNPQSHVITNEELLEFLKDIMEGDCMGEISSSNRNGSHTITSTSSTEKPPSLHHQSFRALDIVTSSIYAHDGSRREMNSNLYVYSSRHIDGDRDAPDGSSLPASASITTACTPPTPQEAAGPTTGIIRSTSSPIKPVPNNAVTTGNSASTIEPEIITPVFNESDPNMKSEDLDDNATLIVPIPRVSLRSLSFNSTILTCIYPGCPYATDRERLYNSHLQHHTDMGRTATRYYQCPVDSCGYITGDSSNMRVHKRRHSGIKPHKCIADDCKFASVHRHALKVHMQRKHPSLLPLVSFTSSSALPSTTSTSVGNASTNKCSNDTDDDSITT